MESQIDKIGEISCEVHKDAIALKSLVEAIGNAFYYLAAEDLECYQSEAAGLCEEIKKTHSVVEGYCNLLDRVAEHLGEVAHETEKIWGVLMLPEVNKAIEDDLASSKIVQPAAQ